MLAFEQIRLEDEAVARVGPGGVVITDSPVVLNYVYSCRAAAHADKRGLYAFERVHKLAWERARLYDLTCVLRSSVNPAAGAGRLAHHTTADVNAAIDQAVVGAVPLWRLRASEISVYDFDQRSSAALDAVSRLISVSAS